jgi:hypothetical protein
VRVVTSTGVVKRLRTAKKWTPPPGIVALQRRPHGDLPPIPTEDDESMLPGVISAAAAAATA